MAQPASPRRLVSVEEYLRSEAESEVRHEYVSGQLFALAGASDAHNQIVANLVSTVRPQVRQTDCRVYANDMMLRLSERLFYYPDLMLLCDPTDNQPLVRFRPCAIIEVLSPSTASIDQREKAFAYKQIRSVMAYLIVHQDVRIVEHHYRVEGDIWDIEQLQQTGDLRIPCPDLLLTLDDIYEDVPAVAGA